MKSIVVVLTCLSLSTLAQPEEITILDNSLGWSEGSLQLNSGTVVNGLLRYNENTGVLAHAEDEQQTLLTPATVVSFEFYDESQQRKRKFRSVEHRDLRTDMLRPYFFEILREYSSFEVLRFISPVELGYKKKYIPDGAIERVYATPTFTQVETVFVMNNEGRLDPYFEIVTVEQGHKRPKSSLKIWNKDLFKEYVGDPMYAKLDVFAKANKLTLKRSDDFLRILSYYDWLLRTEK